MNTTYQIRKTMNTTYQIRKTMNAQKPNINSNKRNSVIMNDSLGSVFETDNFDEVSTLCQNLNDRYDYLGYDYEINFIIGRR